MLHDDTLARLQYLSEPSAEADATEPDDTDNPVPDSVHAEYADRHAAATNDVDPMATVKDDASLDVASDDAMVERETEPPGADPRRSADGEDVPTRQADVEPMRADAGSEREDPFASYPPDLRAHMLHDDTLARLQYLAAPRRQPEMPAGTGPDPVADRVVGSGEGDGRVHEFVEEAEPDEMDQYRRIRAADDVDAVADHSGYPREVVDEVKQHLFLRQHDVAVGPERVEHGYFTPDRRYGELWEKVASGADLDSEQQTQFWSFLAHEYVEAKLMEAGLPYRSDDPEAFDDEGSPDVSSRFPSAHNSAPLSMRSAMTDLLKLWDTRLGIPRGDLRVAADLSNLDEVVRVAKEGLGL